MEALIYISVLVLAWYIFDRYLITKIKNLPPTTWSALSVIGFRSYFKRPIHRILSHIANCHGPILLLRFGCRRVLLISSASAAEDLFKNNDVVFANRPKLVPGKVFGCNFTNLAWASYGSHWMHLRSCVSCFEKQQFGRLPDLLADEVKLLIRQLYCNNNDAIQLKPMFQELVFNVMMRMYAGKSFSGRSCRYKTTGQRKENELISLLEYAIHSFKMTTAESDLTYFRPILKLLGVTGLEQRCTQLQRKGDSLIHNLINKIRENSLKEDSLIQFLLDKQKEDPLNYTKEIISGLVLELVSAGINPSVGILEWAFALLLNHPQVLQKAQNEIDNNVGNKRFLNQSDIDNLPYLKCIVNETMRLYPAAPLLVPHESSKDCKVGGYNVPKGTMLMVNVWAIHNDPNTWEKPRNFNPERFEGIVGKDEFKLMPFGHGLRSCPGKHMAMRVITMALGSLVHCFDWGVFGEERVDMTEQTGLALFKDKPLMVVCRPRSKMNDLLSQI
ncbi:putative cytochrome P450 [Helianthus anomalus]